MQPQSLRVPPAPFILVKEIYSVACFGNHVNVEFVFALKMLKYLLPMRNSVAFRLLALLNNEKLKFTMTKGHSHE